MATFEITGPDGKKYRVTGDTAEGALAALQKHLGVSAAPVPEKSWGQTLKENLLGDNDPTTQNLGEKIGSLLNMGGESMTFGLVGDEASAAVESALGIGNYDERLQHYRDQQALTEKTNPGMSLAAKIAPALLPGAGLAKGVGAIPTLGGKVLAGGLLGGITSGIYGGMEGEGGLQNRLRDAKVSGLIGGVVGGGIPLVGAAIQKVARAISERGAAKAMAKAAPSLDDLSAQAGKLYDAARANGVTATPAQTQSLRNTIGQIASDEGLVTPKGRIAESYPKIRDVLNMIDDYAGGTMPANEMQSVRRTLQSAAGSSDAAERRVGTIMLKAFDNFTSPLAPEFKAANEIYARLSKGKVIETAVELAGSRAGQFSGSGFENALRTEFRALDRQIIKGTLKGLTEAEKAAIKKVANGGTVENIMRDIGKAAPRGIVSTGLGGGVPFMVGNAIGGPGLGATLSATTMGLGDVGRRVATAMQTNNANIASGLMRAGGTLPSLPNAGKAPAGLLEALLFGSLPSQASDYMRSAR